MTLAHRPIQVYLRPDQEAALRRLARAQGVSMAALMRRGIDLVLADVAPEDDALWSIVGIVDDHGPGDMAERHDDYLARLAHDGSDG